MHEFSFSEVALPERHVVCELPMLDFSIGHRLLLLRARNPLLWQEEAEFNQRPAEEQIAWLLEAVYVCAQSFAFRQKLEKEPTRWALWRNKRRVAKWHRLHAHYEVEDWVRELAKFRVYLASAKIISDFDDKRDGFPFMPVRAASNEAGRSLGAPYEGTLIQFLVREMKITEAAAYEYPLGLAQAHFLIYLEREGCLRILNAEELDFKEYVAEYDLKAAQDAGFSTVKEHVAAVLAENAKQKAAAHAAGAMGDGAESAPINSEPSPIN